MGYVRINRDRPSQLTQAISTLYPLPGNNFHQHPPLSREHKGRRKKEAPASHPRGHAAATASVSQLTIKSVPPDGAAIGNRPWPAYCRSVRSPANKAAAITKPNAEAIPIRA